MSYWHFTLKTKERLSLIEKLVQDDVAKNILMTFFNQLMEERKTEYLQASDYERSTQWNGYYAREWTTRIGRLELQVLRTWDGRFSPSIFACYQRNGKALFASLLEMYVSSVSTPKGSQLVEELCGRSVSKSCGSHVTKQLEPMVKEWQKHPFREIMFLYIITDVLIIKVREDQGVVSTGSENLSWAI